MNPRTYCEETVAELLARRARRGSDPDLLQRLLVLSCLRERQLSEEDFARELRELSVGPQGGPGVTSAARAILDDWRRRSGDRS
jgi:hypothetical protein